MRIERISDAAAVRAAAALFDAAPAPDATRDFLAAAGHHLLLAYDDAGEPIGMASGVEMTHPDKGTEMMVYELGVTETARGQGVARSLVQALAGLAAELGCYGMWTATEPDNAAALATYRSAGAAEEATSIVLVWPTLR